MVDKLPVQFRQSAEAAINFDYFEFATGTALTQLYIGDTYDTNIISDNAFYANIGVTTASGGQSIDKDFDLDIGKTLILEGTGTFSFEHAITNSTGGQLNNWTKDVVLKLIKYDGSSETTIVTKTVALLEVAISAGATNYRRYIAELDIPETKLVRGDILRLNITVSAMAANTTLRIAHDPKNRTDVAPQGATLTWNNSEALLNIPLKVDQ